MPTDFEERLKKSEESRLLAWQVLQEIRIVLEILGDWPVLRHAEKSFRTEGNALVLALSDLITEQRFHLERQDQAIETFLAACKSLKLDPDLRHALSELKGARSGKGLKSQALTERKEQLRSMKVLPQSSPS